jgi:hypothetical protein
MQAVSSSLLELAQRLRLNIPDRGPLPVVQGHWQVILLSGRGSVGDVSPPPGVR